jgi:TPR repeat protein
MCLEGNAQEGKTGEDAIACFEESAFLGGDLGEKSMLKLHEIYTEGTLTEKDGEKAMQWLKKAADVKNVDALLKYGLILIDMDSPCSDEFKGIKYLQQALDKGNHEAALHLGKFYRKGIGNKEKAKEFLLIAAEKGNLAEAWCELGKMYSHAAQCDWDEKPEEVDEEQKEKDNQLAMSCFEKAAEYDYTEAYVRMYEIEQLNLGDDMEHGVSGKKCFEWTLKAAKKGHLQALLDMGVNYQMGIGAPINGDKAIEWYRKAYEKGNKTAPYNIAEIYYLGELVPKDIETAKYWYGEAGKLKHESADSKLKEISGNEILNWEQNMDMAKIEQYLTLVYYHGIDHEEPDEEILRTVYQPCIHATASMNPDKGKGDGLVENACLSKNLLELYNAWGELHEAKAYLPFDLPCSISKISEQDLFPYCSFRTIRKLRTELALLWLCTKRKYPAELASVHLANDDGILDIAEAASDNRFTLLLISIVECNIELDGAFLSNEKFVSTVQKLRYSGEEDHDTVLELAGMFYEGTDDVIRSYAVAKEWYQQIPDDPVARERLDAIGEINKR